MPELTDAMYCHQQICIPPTYPYILRQYAKAAIRSQPNDLLRWSAAYFRALANDLPPPIKLRLEYPIITTHYGLTPGWLKTLIKQFAGFTTVQWPQLYDRWKGICLQINGLQEIIMMAGFNEPSEIPWYKFIACAAAHLTTTLTNTMILVCELLTDEPEGGSSMIPFTVFEELYKFLAEIDGCDERIVLNYYFTESNLDLLKMEAVQMEEEEEEEGKSEATAQFEEEEEEQPKQEATETAEIDPHRSDLERYLKGISVDAGEEGEEKDIKIIAVTEIKETQSKPEKPKQVESKSDETQQFIILNPEDGNVCDMSHKKLSSEESSESTEKAVVKEVSKETTLSFKSIELFEETEEIQMEASEEPSSMSISSTRESEDIRRIKLPLIPGIGPVVPPDMIDAVIVYMKDCSLKQQGMVMPRNIKHFLCPPLELFCPNEHLPKCT